MMNLILAYDNERQILDLFQQYAESILAEGQEVLDCLQTQHFDEEVQDLKKKYGLPDGRLYLAMADGEAVGCCALTKNTDEICEVKRLFVLPEHRGRHLGECLLKQVISDAREIGYRWMRLDTFPFMKSAIQLYEKFGFRYIDRYNDNPARSALFMQLEL